MLPIEHLTRQLAFPRHSDKNHFPKKGISGLLRSRFSAPKSNKQKCNYTFVYAYILKQCFHTLEFKVLCTIPANKGKYAITPLLNG